MNIDPTFNCSFRCYFDSGECENYTMHYQRLRLSDVPRWLDAYHFTHPNCTAITVKVWFNSANAEE